MPDDMDATVALEERFHEMQLQRAAAQARLRAGPVPNGTCYNPKCGDDVPEGRAFCDSECRDQWEIYKRIGK